MSRTQNEIKHFSKLEHIWWGAKTYSGQKRYDYKLKALREYCKPKSSQKILEIGCGDGEFTKRLASLKNKIIATDLTPAVIKRAKTLLKYKNVKFEVDNSEKMKFKDNSFDIVCGISILHHTNYRNVIKEMYRVLKKDGQLFFTEPNLINPIIFAGLNIEPLRKRMEFSPNETALIRWNIKKLLKDAGFEKYKVVNYDFVHPTTSKELFPRAKRISNTLEKIPLVKELSGSLIIWAKK